MSLPETVDRQDSWFIIALGFAQGLAIYGLTKAGMDTWAAAHPWLHHTLWGWTIIMPPSAQWVIAHRERRGYWALLGVIGALIPLVCWEPASAIVPQAPHSSEEVLIIGGALAWAALISLASAALGGGLADYPTLFRLTCRTALLPLGALLFTVIFSALLWLWGALFDLIAIGFFKRLFGFDWFIWPVRGVVFGVATAILLERPMLMDGVRRAGTAIAAALLPVVVVIHLLFLGGLLFAGLEPLWATRHATPLVLTLLIAFLILLNGTHEEGTKLNGEARPLAALTRIAILLSPIYVAIAAYSLSLRVAQYGWSPDRVVSACIIGFVGTVVVTYFVAALGRPFLTVPRLARANVAALVILALVGIGVNSPLLSPHRIASGSQEARILAGRIAPDKVDWETLAFDLGRYGRETLAKIKGMEDLPYDGQIQEQAESALAAKTRYALSAQTSERRKNARFKEDSYSVVPGNTPIPAGLVDTFITDKRWDVPPICDLGCKILAVDLNQDGAQEMILLAGEMPVYGRDRGQWSRIGKLIVADTPDRPAIIKKIGEGSVRPVPSDWLDLDAEGQRLRFVPER